MSTITDFKKKLSSDVVINTNKDAYIQAQREKQKILKERNKFIELENRVSSMEKTLHEILSLLKGTTNG